jgi:hypothetical protein
LNIRIPVIEALFKVGLKIIPEYYSKTTNYTMYSVKYGALVEGYLKCFLGFEKDMKWDVVYEAIESDCERAYVTRRLSIVFDDWEYACKEKKAKYNYKESPMNPDGKDFEFLKNLESFEVLLKAVERADTINRCCNYEALLRLDEINEVMKIDDEYEGLCMKSYMAVVMMQNMQLMKDEMMISSWVNEYDFMWLEEGRKICRRDSLLEKMRGMWSSKKRLKCNFKL